MFRMQSHLCPLRAYIAQVSSVQEGCSFIVEVCLLRRVLQFETCPLVVLRQRKQTGLWGIDSLDFDCVFGVRAPVGKPRANFIGMLVVDGFSFSGREGAAVVSLVSRVCVCQSREHGRR